MCLRSEPFKELRSPEQCSLTLQALFYSSLLTYERCLRKKRGSVKLYIKPYFLHKPIGPRSPSCAHSGSVIYCLVFRNRSHWSSWCRLLGGYHGESKPLSWFSVFEDAKSWRTTSSTSTGETNVTAIQKTSAGRSPSSGLWILEYQRKLLAVELIGRECSKPRAC